MKIARKTSSAIGHFVFLLFTLCLATGPASVAQQSGYTITDLGPVVGAGDGLLWFNGDTVTSVSMNAAGDVVAGTPTGSGNTHAALFHNGQVIDLGTLGGLNSQATGINKSGRSSEVRKLRAGHITLPVQQQRHDGSWNAGWGEQLRHRH